MGQPTQAAGVAVESAASIATNGFSGWSPDPSRTVYTLQSGSANKRGPAELGDAVSRLKQFYR